MLKAVPKFASRRRFLKFSKQVRFCWEHLFTRNTSWGAPQILSLKVCTFVARYKRIGDYVFGIFPRRTQRQNFQVCIKSTELLWNIPKTSKNWYKNKKLKNKIWWHFQPDGALKIFQLVKIRWTISRSLPRKQSFHIKPR